MSIIIRIVIIAACAYAGSAIAGAQFRDLPDHHQIAQKNQYEKADTPNPRTATKKHPEG
jgi:hypothetical protein